MTSLKILAASLLVVLSMPALATPGSESVPNQAHQFFQQNRAASAVQFIEGRNSAPIVNRTRAATPRSSR